MYLATLLLSIQMVMAEPSTDQPMSPSEIYGLMDNGDWQTALLQAQRLADAQPSNALALLTLGDALAQYPNGSGDVFAAFDVWNQAKTVAVKGSRTQRFVQERLGWTLQHSALLKVVPMSSTGMRWWDSSFSYEMYLDKEIDLKGRTDYLKGAIYISNLPSEEIILEVQPGKGLPTLIQTFTPKKGEMQTIFVPADMASLRVALEQGQFVTKETGGRAILDRYVQKQIADDDLMMSFTTDSMPLPPFTFPQNTSIFLRNDEGNRVPYTIGVSDEVKGGRYVLEIHQEHHVTYADVVVHRDLVAQTIHDIVTDPAKQRATYESLESSSDEVAVVSDEAVSETVETPQVPSTNSDSDNVDEPIVNTTEVDDKPVVAEAVEEIPVTENTETQIETVSPVDVPVQEEQPTGVEEDGDGIEEQPIPETNTVEVSTETLAEPSTESKPFVGNVAELEPVFAKLNTRLAVGLAIGAAYTANAGYQAMQQIDAANAEMSSQNSYNTASTEADFWRTQYVGGMIFSSQVVVAYITSRILEYRLSQFSPDSSEVESSDVLEGVAQ